MINIRPITIYTITYAPFREDIILNDLLDGKAEGGYIDVGAGHPMQNSATRFFYEIGWKGINITPSERTTSLLQKVRSRDVNIQASITKKELESIEYTEFLGQSNKLRSYKKTYLVHATTLRKVVAMYPMYEIDFLRISDPNALEVLDTYDWESVRPKILCVSACSGVETYAESIGYNCVYSDGKNHYFADSQLYGSDLPKVTDTVFSPHIVSQYVAQDIYLLHQRLDELRHSMRNIKEKKTRASVGMDDIRFREMGRLAIKKIDAFIQGMLLPAVSYEETRPYVDLKNNERSLNNWFAIADDYNAKVHASKWRPRRLLFAFYSRTRKLIVFIHKRTIG